MLAQKEGDVCAANTKFVSCRGCAGAVLLLCWPHRAEGAIPQWGSLFPSQLFPTSPRAVGSRAGGWVPITSRARLPVWKFELITYGPQAPPTTRSVCGQQTPHREGSLLPHTHSDPITKCDRPGTPPGISGGFLMQHSGRISVPGFALSWFLKHTDIQAWASSFPVCARALLPVKPQSPWHSSSAPYVGSARRLAERNGTKTVDRSSVEGLYSSQDR